MVQAARAVLEGAWDPARGYCYPNRHTYPHLWLWDSCFHAIAWAAVGDGRCLTELDAVFAGQFADGFVPHMRYARPTIRRGPLEHASSFTQPPVYAHAAGCAAEAGFTPATGLVASIRAGLEWLWQHRLREGLLVVVHPWETGADDSPRWDSWVGSSHWERERWTAFDRALVEATAYHPNGAAASSCLFTAAPAAFNALAADAAAAYGRLAEDPHWERRAADLAAAIDERLWNDETGLWDDLAVVGGGASVSVPTLDGALPALVTADEERAQRVLARLADRGEFLAPFGLRYVPASHPAYEAGQYWRGSSWMPLNYVALRAAHRWGDAALAEYLAAAAGGAALASGFAEHWDPETGAPLGAVPQTWTALAAAFYSTSGTSSTSRSLT